MAMDDGKAIPPDGDSSPGNAELFPEVRDYLHSRLHGLEPDPGAVEAWDWFVRTHDRHIPALCRRYGRTKTDAEDLAQEVRLRLVRCLLTFRYDPNYETFCAWLESFVRRVLSDLAHARPSVLAMAVHDDEELARMVSHAPDPAGEYEQGRRDRIVREVLDRLRSSLPPLSFRAFVMRYMEGRRHAEIAAVLEISEGCVRQRTSWVKNKFRVAIENHPEFRSPPGPRA